VQLIKFTLRRGPTVQTEMSLATAGIHCTISQRLSGAMEDCSIVRGRQPRTLCHQRCHDAYSARCRIQPPLTSICDKTAVRRLGTMCCQECIHCTCHVLVSRFRRSTCSCNQTACVTLYLHNFLHSRQTTRNSATEDCAKVDVCSACSKEDQCKVQCIEMI